MASSAVASDPLANLMKDSDWRSLIRAVRRRNVIPVLGADLMQVQVGDRRVTYDHYVAEELARREGITNNELVLMGTSVEQATLNDVVSVCIGKYGDRVRWELHDEVWQIMVSSAVQPPRALRQLAEITDINLFVTSTPDSIFESELRRVGLSTIDARVYRRDGKQKKEDIPEDARTTQECRFLYYLFGKAEQGTMDFPICDEDLLRFVLKLQDSVYRPKILFDELRENNLLLLGVNFSDWLARFFLWLAKDRENLTVEAARNLREYLADQKAGQDRPLVLFLQQFSQSTLIVGNQPEEFVNELHRRWLEQSGQSPAPEGLEAKPSSTMPRRAVFLSYSRSDAAAVKALFVALTQNGIPAWYDAALTAGDDFDPKLEYNIANCSLFVPLLSTGSLAREQGYFRREWKRAVERDEAFYGSGRGSIIPVVIDDDDAIMSQPQAYQGMPKRFRELQMYHCPMGRASSEVIASLKGCLQDAP